MLRSLLKSALFDDDDDDDDDDDEDNDAAADDDDEMKEADVDAPTLSKGGGGVS